MNVEVRKVGSKKKFYLAHSYRKGSSIKKIRVYLGVDLSAEQLDAAKKIREEELQKRISDLDKIKDPYLTILSKKEIRELDSIKLESEIRLMHLSELEWETFTELFTYDTNAIEGSKVNKREVEGILEKNVLPEKSRGDISETFGVAEAVKFIRATDEHLSIDLIKVLHWMVFKNSKQFAGQLRPKGVEVGIYDSAGNVVHHGSPSGKVPRLLEQLVEWYNKNKKRYRPLVLAAVVHNQFENIHPFQDGNGRIGRLLLINILMKNGLPPVNIELDLRDEYYHALQTYEKFGNLRPTIDLLLKEYRRLKKALRKR